jgi:spore coat polysaccharide biosynthesis protein SpsF
VTRHTVAIIQARMASTRLAGKTLLDIAGQPLLGHVIDRVLASRRIEGVVVATTTDPSDDPIEKFAAGRHIAVFRGSIDDVLDRFYKAALQSEADPVVRITADDPFKDPEVIDQVVERLLSDPRIDYASNTIEPTFPEGLDVEAFKASALERAWRQATLQSEREHVTPFIWKHPELFRLESVRHPTNLSHMRWTLDYDEDLRFTRAVYSRLYRGQVFTMAELLKLQEADPSLGRINSGIKRNIGYNESLKRDLTTGTL